MNNERIDWDKRIGVPDSFYPIPDNQERLLIYTEALKRVEADKMKFICVCILDAYERIHEMKVEDDSVVLNLFPEFINQKPEGELLDGSWFGIRIEI